MAYKPKSPQSTQGVEKLEESKKRATTLALKHLSAAQAFRQKNNPISAKRELKLAKAYYRTAETYQKMINNLRLVDQTAKQHALLKQRQAQKNLLNSNHIGENQFRLKAPVAPKREFEPLESPPFHIRHQGWIGATRNMTPEEKSKVIQKMQQEIKNQESEKRFPKVPSDPPSMKKKR